MKRFIEKDFPRLLDLVYDAGLDRERWPTFLDALGQSFGGAKGTLHFYDRQLGATPSFMMFGVEPEFLAAYQQHFRQLNPYPEPSFSAPVGKVVFASDMVPEPQMNGTEFFNDWMKPQGISLHHLRVVLKRDSDRLVALGLSPPERALAKDHGRYARQFELLVPHVSRAIDLNRIAAAARFASRAAADALRSLVMPAFVLDRARLIVLANVPAEELIRAESVFSLDQNGALHAARPEDDSGLEAALAAGAHSLHPAPVRLVSRASGQAFIASVIPAGRIRESPASASAFSRRWDRPTQCCCWWFRSTGTSRSVPRPSRRSSGSRQPRPGLPVHWSTA